MAQNYKVFYKDYPFIISGSSISDHDDNYGIISEINSKAELKDAVMRFLKTPEAGSNTLFYTKEPEKVLPDLASLFWYLEAAGGIVRNSEGRRLFIHRFGKWDLPKGKLEKDEVPTQAALREVEEETGITVVEPTLELPPTFHIYDYKGKKVLKQTFWFAMEYNGNKTPVPQQEEEITQAEWIDLADMDRIIGNSYASLLDLIRYDIDLRH